MSVFQHHSAAALQQRCRVIGEAVGWESASHEEDPVRRLLSVVRDGRFEIAQAAYLCYQAFYARVPSRSEITAFTKHFEVDSDAMLVDFFCTHKEFKTGPQASVRFERVPAESLLVDVSHTLNCTQNSGIQRVVRSAIRQMRDAGLSHTLVRYDGELGNYRVLSEQETDRVYDWERLQHAADSAPGAAKARPPAEHSPAPPKRKSALKRLIQKITGRRLDESVRSFLRTWKQHRKPKAANVTTTSVERSPSRRHDEATVAFCWRNRMLFPEFMGEPQRTEGVFVLMSHAEMCSTMILYDLIAIKRPEYFGGILDGFVRYLSLLRVADRVSCISEAVADDLRLTLPLLDRDRAAPRIAAHHLGSDFDFAGGKSAPETTADLPVVLSVGTIEIRKNHWRTLRGLMKAQQRGRRFKAIFAGNPGWLNENFMQELARYQAEGFQVELRQSVSEAELSQLYQSAKFTVYCSLAEGFGLPIVESVQKGVPCVTSDRGCMKEIAERMGGCLLVNPESEDEIATAVENMLDGDALYNRLSREAREAEWPTWREYAESLYDFAAAAEHRHMKIRVAA